MDLAEPFLGIHSRGGTGAFEAYACRCGIVPADYWQPSHCHAASASATASATASTSLASRATSQRYCRRRCGCECHVYEYRRYRCAQYAPSASAQPACRTRHFSGITPTCTAFPKSGSYFQCDRTTRQRWRRVDNNSTFTACSGRP